MPKSCPGVDAEILNPRNLWEDKAAYDAQAKVLAKKFADNFKRFETAPEELVKAGPVAE